MHVNVVQLFLSISTLATDKSRRMSFAIAASCSQLPKRGDCFASGSLMLRGWAVHNSTKTQISRQTVGSHTSCRLIPRGRSTLIIGARS